MSREDFSRYWREVHAPLALKYQTQLKLKGYVQNHVLDLPDGAEPQFDGIDELLFDSMQDFNAMMDFYNSEAGKEIRDDEENFADRNVTVFLLVEENVVI